MNEDDLFIQISLQLSKLKGVVAAKWNSDERLSRELDDIEMIISNHCKNLKKHMSKLKEENKNE